MLQSISYIELIFLSLLHSVLYMRSKSSDEIFIPVPACSASSVGYWRSPGGYSSSGHCSTSCPPRPWSPSGLDEWTGCWGQWSAGGWGQQRLQASLL